MKEKKNPKVIKDLNTHTNKHSFKKHIPPEIQMK